MQRPLPLGLKKVQKAKGQCDRSFGGNKFWNRAEIRTCGLKAKQKNRGRNKLSLINQHPKSDWHQGKILNTQMGTWPKQEGATEWRNLIACRIIVRWAYTLWTCCQQRGQLAGQSPSHWPEQGLWKGKKKKQNFNGNLSKQQQDLERVCKE